MEARAAEHAEQRAIVSAAFAPAFAALKGGDGHLGSLAGPLHLRPHIALVEAPLAAPHTAAGGGGGGAHARAARVGASLGVILQEMSEELRRATRWLLPTVLLSLAQKAWTSLLSELNSLLLRHLYVPRAIGGALGADLLEALNASSRFSAAAAAGPPRLAQRRAAPLVATLQLLDTPTGALVAAHAQQADGCRRAPPRSPPCLANGRPVYGRRRRRGRARRVAKGGRPAR